MPNTMTSTTPSAKNLTRSHALIETIRQCIHAANGPISFAEFVKLALYHPKLGYYTSHQPIFGAEGDFITAPEISPLFGQCLSAAYQQAAQHLPQKHILELGAGSGKLAADILSSLDAHNQTPERYFILEASPLLIEQQRLHITTQCPQLINKVHWLDKLPEQFSGMIFANEVLDALPAHRFIVTENGAQELGVNWEQGHFIWQPLSQGNPQVIEAAKQLKSLHQLPIGYQSEINLEHANFISQLAQSLKQGCILFSDYGYGQNEYYHPERNQGTLSCFYQHQQTNNPFHHPGLTDISCHVDFSRVIEAANLQGLELLGFTTQAGFLLGSDITTHAQALESTLSEIEQFELHQAIKTLILPTEMGDCIKFMGLGKDFGAQLNGFNILDRRRDL